MNSYQNNQYSDFNGIVQSISDNVRKITQNVQDIKRLIKQLEIGSDDNNIISKLQNIQHNTHQLAKDTKEKFHEFGTIPKVDEFEERKRKLQKDRLLEQFTQSLNTFQSLQRETEQREKQLLAKARTSSSISIPGDQDPFGDNSTAGQSNYKSQTLQILENENDVDLGQIREREEAIRQLEEDITDVNQIFKDLATLVYDQGETIDNIEVHVERASDNVTSATSQLDKAKTYQTKARKKKCFCIVLLIVILAIIGLVLFLKFGVFNGSDATNTKQPVTTTTSGSKG